MFSSFCYQKLDKVNRFLVSADPVPRVDHHRREARERAPSVEARVPELTLVMITVDAHEEPLAAVAAFRKHAVVGEGLVGLESRLGMW